MCIPANPTDEELHAVSAKVRHNDILVINKTVPALELTLEKISGMIVEEGGDVSHAAIVAREKGIPAIIGARGAVGFFELSQGQEATLDATSSRVYAGRVPATAIRVMSRADYDQSQFSDERLSRKLSELRMQVGDPGDMARLGRPASSMSLLQADLYHQAFVKTLNVLGVAAPNEIFVRPCSAEPKRRVFETTRGSMNCKLFDALERRDLSELTALFEQRVRAVLRFQRASDSLVGTGVYLGQVLDDYREMICFFHFRWLFGRHLECRYLETLRAAPARERPYAPVFFLFRQEEPPLAALRARAAVDLWKELQGTQTWRTHFAGGKGCEMNWDQISRELAIESAAVVERVEGFGRSFPVRDDVDMSLGPPALAQSLKTCFEALETSGEGGDEWAYSPSSCFGWAQLLAKHSAQAEREHVLQIRLQFVVRDHLIKSEEELKRRGLLGSSDSVFDWTAESLLAAVSKLGPNGVVNC